MLVRRIVHTLCGVVLLGVLATSVTGASFNANRTTHFTFSGAVQLPGVTLPAGTYTFEVVNTNSGSDIVSVRSRDRSKVYLMQFTRAVYRPSASTLKASITFGETPAGTPPPVKAWYPESETRGREFIY
jgi:Protein of unknown function (DUF2911)